MARYISRKGTLYILKHPKPGFSGQWGPVGFDNGIGSTSSQEDRDLMVERLGCEDITKKHRATQKEGSI